MFERVKVRKAQVKDVLNRTFPDYKGRKLFVVVTDKVTFNDTNWGGGSRNQYVAISADGRTGRFVAPAPWINPIEGKTVELSEDVAIVCHSIFCGQDCGITIYVAPMAERRLLSA